MIVGFVLAAYSVIANDAIQTLGTFLSSNRDKKWWQLWAFASAIVLGTMLYGWFMHDGDVSYGRLSKVGDLPSPFHWWYVLPPLVLLIITRLGIPVSTTFLILTVFALSNLPDGDTLDVLKSMTEFGNKDAKMAQMLKKSLMGYALAIGLGLAVYFAISKKVESKFLSTQSNEAERKKWVVFQWVATGFLWSMWLIQDLANIFVYLPRELEFWHFALSIIWLLALLAFIFRKNGGEIQKIVTSKTNTTDIRSATIIDFIYGLILLFFKEYSKFPMSTTWVFLGLLAGREIAMNFMLNHSDRGTMFKMILKDLGKVTLGLIVSVIIVLIIHGLQ